MDCPVDGCNGKLRRVTKEELMDPEFRAEHNLTDEEEGPAPRPKYICGGQPTKHVFREGFDGDSGVVLIGETPPIVGQSFPVDRDALPSE